MEEHTALPAGETDVVVGSEEHVIRRAGAIKPRRIAFACDDHQNTFEALSWALVDLATQDDTLVLVHIVKPSERKDSHDDRYAYLSLSSHMGIMVGFSHRG